MVAVDQWAGEARVARLKEGFASTANAVHPLGFVTWSSASVHNQRAGNLLVPMVEFAPMARGCWFFQRGRGERVHQQEALMSANPPQYGDK